MREERVVRKDGERTGRKTELSSCDPSTLEVILQEFYKSGLSYSYDISKLVECMLISLGPSCTNGFSSLNGSWFGSV